MKSYTLSDEDAQQVRAILLTHAEMQDQHTLANEELRGRMTQGLSASEDPTDDQETINDLVEIHEEVIEDRDNLKRIASIFE